MAIGRTFQESMQKALRGLETGIDGFSTRSSDREEIVQEIGEAGPERILFVADAFRIGMSLEEIFDETAIDPWFLSQIEEIVSTETKLAGRTLESLSAVEMRFLKAKGFSDRRLASLLKVGESTLRAQRHAQDVRPVYKRVDTCAAEFATQTAYMYSTYDEECEAEPTSRKKIMVLGGGPNRIGQGIEFDYCCVHAALAMREDGYETIMVNCNPETVSTDYDTSDRLYFEPVTLEDVLEIVAKEKPLGMIASTAGRRRSSSRSSSRRPACRSSARRPTRSTSPKTASASRSCSSELGLRQPPNRTARTEDQAIALAQEIGYPLVVRPSYVLGGRAMEIVHGDKDLERYMREAVKVSEKSPVLLDRFLDDAIEVNVDCIADASGEVMIGGIRSTSSRRASTPATRPARCRRTRCRRICRTSCAGRPR